MTDWLIVAMVASATSGTPTQLIDVVVNCIHAVSDGMACEAKREMLDE